MRSLLDWSVNLYTSRWHLKVKCVSLVPERKQVRTKTELALQNFWALQRLGTNSGSHPLWHIHQPAHKSDASIFVAVEAFCFSWVTSGRGLNFLPPSRSCLKVTWSSTVPSSLSPARHYSLCFGCGPVCFPNVCFVRLQLDLTLCDSILLESRSECEGSRLCLSFWKHWKRLWGDIKIWIIFPSLYFNSLWNLLREDRTGTMCNVA